MFRCSIFLDGTKVLEKDQPTELVTELVKQAVQTIISKEMGYRRAAEQFKIPRLL